jgi:putative ABC transport system substrate-binding protein
VPRRRTVFRQAASIGLVLLAACAPARKSARVGFLGAVWRDAPETTDTVRQALRELGWVEGDNLTLEWRYTTGTEPHLDEVVADLVRQVDIVVVNNEPHARAVLRASAVMPIVLGAHPDPVATGLVASLDRPGGMVTGNGGTSGGVVFHKRLELLKGAHPGLSLVALLFNSTASPAVNAVQLPAIREAAQRLGVDLHMAEVHTAAELLGSLSAAVDAGADGLFVVQDPVNLAHREQVVRFAADAGLPAMYPGNVWVQAGGLMSFGASAVAGNRAVAFYVDRILRGARPADLPIQQGAVFDFEVNLRAAEALGIELPPWVASQVTRWSG